MVTLNIKTDFRNVTRYLNDVQRKQLPFAAAKALTLTAKRVERVAVDEMRSKFDRPTPFVLRGLRTKPAKKNDLQAMVYVKDFPISGHNSFGEQYQSGLANIIGHQFGGGRRQRKLLEMRFQQQGLITPSEYLVPGRGAKLDAYGNISRGQIQHILSQLFIRQSGYDNTPTGSKRSKRNQAKAGQIFWSSGITGNFSSRGHNGTLSKGVWQRMDGGRHLKPLLIVVSRPAYRQLINLNAIAQQVMAKDFQQIFGKTMEEALRTAR